MTCAEQPKDLGPSSGEGQGADGLVKAVELPQLWPSHPRPPPPPPTPQKLLRPRSRGRLGARPTTKTSISWLDELLHFQAIVLKFGSRLPGRVVLLNFELKPNIIARESQTCNLQLKAHCSICRKVVKDHTGPSIINKSTWMDGASHLKALTLLLEQLAGAFLPLPPQRRTTHACVMLPHSTRSSGARLQDRARTRDHQPSEIKPCHTPPAPRPPWACAAACVTFRQRSHCIFLWTAHAHITSSPKLKMPSVPQL